MLVTAAAEPVKTTPAAGHNRRPLIQYHCERPRLHHAAIRHHQDCIQGQTRCGVCRLMRLEEKPPTKEDRRWEGAWRPRGQARRHRGKRRRRRRCVRRCERPGDPGAREGGCAVLSACWAAFSFSVDLLGCVAFRKPLSALQSRAASPLVPPKAQAV